MGVKRTVKTFDCIDMKRRIQEKIYNETCDMGSKELLEYFHSRVAQGSFAHFFPELKTNIEKNEN